MACVTLPLNFRSDTGNLVTCSLENSEVVEEVSEDGETTTETTVWTKTADVHCEAGAN
jgi:hypothetical protein